MFNLERKHLFIAKFVKAANEKENKYYNKNKMLHIVISGIKMLIINFLRFVSNLPVLERL